MDVAELRRRIADGESFELLLFYGHVSGSREVGPTCLSQFYPAPFTHDGETFRTAEHWMMAGKARVFGDLETRALILESVSPAQAKRYGRNVQRFDQATWDRDRFAIVVEGSRHKFASDPALREFLVGTGDKVLVEASPRDRIWGIGLGRDHPDARTPAKWRGSNLLGFALMEARTRLRFGPARAAEALPIRSI